jgi:hypothetical protein
LPLIISAAASAFLISIASQQGSVALACLGATPFVLTFLYMLIFQTGRRPHFTRDLVELFLQGKAISPLAPAYQPRNPGIRAGSQNR